jgi:deazaflavin-dependent oxidoreductase (nitroreductase family)
MGILEHVGRRSGNAYRTPLNVFSTDEGVAVLLTYGPNRDWLKNLTAAGKGRMRRHGKTFTVTDPRVMTKEEAAPSVKGLWRPIFSMLPFEKALLLRRAD